MSAVRHTLDGLPFARRTGRGVRVAVVDSGVTAGHPHVGLVSESVSIEGEVAAATAIDALDRLGHGTAVAAAIKEKAPAVELVSVKVFDRSLATSADVLARAITWATDRGAHLINLSLGTANPERADLLRTAVDHAASCGAIVISARESDGVTWLPGSLTGVAGVLADWQCEREELTCELDDGGRITLSASAYPRPIPGVPRERNLSGVSFAVANVTGFLARLLEGNPATRTVMDVGTLLRRR
jgi:subtilisin family serine protease